MVPFHSGMSTCLLRSPVHASHEAWKWGQKQRKDTKRCLLSLSLAAAVCCNWISLPKHKANVPSSIQRDTARFQRSPPAVWWIFWFSFYWAGTPGLLLLHGKWIVPFPEALLDGFSGYVVWWEGVPFLLFFSFFFVWGHWGMSYLLCVCRWGVCMCQAVIVLIFGLKFCKGETQELLVAACSHVMLLPVTEVLWFGRKGTKA